MLNFPEIVPRNVYDCGSSDDEEEFCHNILEHQGEVVEEEYFLPG